MRKISAFGRKLVSRESKWRNKWPRKSLGCVSGQQFAGCLGRSFWIRRLVWHWSGYIVPIVSAGRECTR